MNDQLKNTTNESQYELALLLREENLTAIKVALEKNGMKVVKEGGIEKVRLAYPIKKQAMGYFVNFLVLGDRSLVDKLVQELNLSSELLRYTLTKFDERKPRNEGSSQDNPKEKDRRSTRVSKKIAEPALTNEALEKKIEEILK